MTITRKPMQRDLFSGALVTKRPKSGRGNHVLLKHNEGDKYPVPGMAHFAGTGPEGRRCQHCRFLEDIPVWQRRGDLPYSTPAKAGYDATKEPRRYEANACRKACEMSDGLVRPGGIEFESACKYFEPRE